MNPSLLSPKIIAPGGGRAKCVFGVRVDILLTGQDTAGAQCTYECTVEPGGGPPPHVHHHEDEAFFILEGQFEVLCGDQVAIVGPGSFVYLPKGTPHTFKNVGQQTGHFLGIANPAGHEHFFEDADQLARSGMFTPEQAVAVCQRHGIDVLM